MKLPLEKVPSESTLILGDSHLKYGAEFTDEEKNYLQYICPIYQVEEDLPNGGKMLFTKVVSNIDNLELCLDTTKGGVYKINILSIDGQTKSSYVGKKTLEGILREYRKLSYLMHYYRKNN